ncbi:Rv2175c family DNA-binding protein [Frondihabitans sp. VKM Ac-2883]|uniref:Rv2175c family DNA-binding protein n=1 Tax=Frondihabitans sp. VKM Ac-2883 TaxID=2783823 RepID=UPI00351C462C
MTDISTRPWFSDITWLTLPDAADRLGTTASRVRRMLDERVLVAAYVDGVRKIPALFIVDGEPMHELRGTLTVLHDNHFSDDESLDWMLSDEESLGTSPVAALQAGRKAEVRRIAQSLL